MVYFCGYDSQVKAWSISDKQLKYEINQRSAVYDIVIGRKGTPLENRLVSIGYQCCRISSLETGAEVKRIELDSYCWSIAVDKAQTVIAIGTDKKVVFIKTTNFTNVKEVSLEKRVFSLAFNKRNDCMFALTNNGEVHSFKFSVSE